MDTQLIFLHALSPLHPGTGQGADVIDLPIAREKATGIPYFPGSSLKGSLRAACLQGAREAIFGPEKADNNAYAGALQITDLRLLLLPVRSLAGTFAWVTSPFVLRRFARDMRDVGQDLPKVNPPKDIGHIFILGKTLIADQQKVYLEDLDLQAHVDDEAVRKWANWLSKTLFKQSDDQDFLRDRLAIVHDDMLAFLLNTATEITARIRMEEDTKTVAHGGLWYEEALPAETILAGMAIIEQARGAQKMDEASISKTIGAIAQQRPLQLGGKATVGRGLCRVILTKGA